jgi:hypothetical protein
MPRSLRLVAPGALGASLLALAVLSSPSAAKPPDPRFSGVTPVLVGTPAGDAILLPPSLRMGPEGPGFHVDMRTVNNEPGIGDTAILDFSGCSGVRIYTSQQTGVTVDCANHRMYAQTTTGDYTFFPRLGGFDNQPDCWVEGNGVILAAVPVRSTDMDGAGGSTGLADVARFMGYYLAGATDHPEADFNGSGGPIDLTDFGIISRSYFEGVVGTYCP